jgi:hypothetical protein
MVRVDRTLKSLQEKTHARMRMSSPGGAGPKGAFLHTDLNFVLTVLTVLTKPATARVSSGQDGLPST